MTIRLAHLLAPLALFCLSCADAGRHDATPREIRYVIVTPRAFAEGAGRLAAHREKGGLATEVVTTDAIAARFPTDGLGQLLRERSRLRKGGGPLYVLLIGDCDALPSFTFPPRYDGRFLTSRMTEPIAADGCWDADEGDPFFSVAVGRLPADTPEELDAMIEKIVRFESAPPSLADLAMEIVGSAPDFDPMIDAAIERVFARVMDECVPPAVNVNLLYGVPSSPYCAYPPEFNKTVAERYNASPLVFAYVGHGSENGFHDVRWQGKRHPTIDRETLRKFERHSRQPLMFSLACLTGCIDRPTDGIGEELIKLPAGPSAFVGATRITHPAGNSLYGMALLRTFGRRPAGSRLGDILLGARREMLKGMKDPFSRTILAMTALSEQNATEAPELLKKIRRDTLLNYILLGDPAMVLPPTGGGIVLRTPESHPRGQPLTAEIAGAAGTELTLELRCRRSESPRDLTRAAETPEGFADLCRAANDKTILRRQIRVDGASTTVAIPLPPTLRAGRYVLVVRGLDRSGIFAAAKEIRITD